MAEEQDIDKLGKLCSERKVCRQKRLATLCLSGRQMCTVPMFEQLGWSYTYTILPPQLTEVQVAVNN